MNRYLTLTLLFLLVRLIDPPITYSQEDGSLMTEVRAVWMHPELLFSADPETGRQEVRRFVERVANANFNLIFPWVRSEYVAALTDENYQKSMPIAKWDALGELIKVAHEKGLQVHLWYSFTNYKSRGSPEFNPKHGGSLQWAARRIDELVPDKVTNKITPRRMTDVCPLHSEAREWELNLIEKILDRYPLLSGVHIEEPGYRYNDDCVCDLCLQEFKSIYGFDETKDVSGPQAEDLKSLGTSEFMRKLHESLRKRNPKLVLSTNGSFSWKSDRQLGRDWKHWAQLGWLDSYAAQIYTADITTFQTRTQTVISDLGKYCSVLIGIDVRGKNTVEVVLKEVDVARQLGAKGFVFFRGDVLTDEYLSALKAGPFKHAAILPTNP